MSGSRKLESEVLESLYAHRLLTTHQLLALHTPPGETRSQRWMQLLLGRMRDRGLVASASRHGNPRLACWYVTETGADVIDAAGACPGFPRVVPSREGAEGALQSHTLAVNDVGVALAGWARVYGHECGHLSWHHEVAHRCSDGQPGQRAETVVADALAHYAATDEVGRVMLASRWIELDRATMSTQQVGDKLRRYVRYARYVPKDATDGRPAWQHRYPGLPGVVVVLAGQPRPVLEGRRHRLASLAQLDPLVAGASQPTISLVMLDDLHDCGPFAPIFTRVDRSEPVDLLGRPATEPEAGELAAEGAA